jgi:hypothetical protein
MYPLKCNHASSVKANSQTHKRLLLKIRAIPGNWQATELKQNSKLLLKGSANVVSVNYNRGLASYACAFFGIYIRLDLWVASYTVHSLSNEHPCLKTVVGFILRSYFRFLILAVNVLF